MGPSVSAVGQRTQKVTRILAGLIFPKGGGVGLSAAVNGSLAINVPSLLMKSSPVPEHCGSEAPRSAPPAYCAGERGSVGCLRQFCLTRL